MASNRCEMRLVSIMELPCRNVMSTISSGRSDEGKNCFGTRGSAASESTKASSVVPTIFLGCRMAHKRARWKSSAVLPALALCACRCSFSTFTPMSGANSTATNHETIRAMHTTAKRENVYSPAELFASPMGIKPKMVTSVPVSMGKAVEV